MKTQLTPAEEVIYRSFIERLEGVGTVEISIQHAADSCGVSYERAKEIVYKD